MATLYPHRLIFAAGAALDSPKTTVSARVTPAGSAVTTAGFNPDLDTSQDFNVAVNRRTYLRLIDQSAPASENLTRVPITSLFVDPSPETPNPFPISVFTGFSQIIDIRVSPVETIFTLRVEQYESVVSFATKSTTSKEAKSVRYAAHVTPVPRERDDTVFLNEYQLRIPRWAYDQFRQTFNGYEFNEIGIRVDLSNNSPFPLSFPIDDVKIEQGIATVTQGVFRVSLLEYPHSVRFRAKSPGVQDGTMKCRVEPREIYFRGTEDDLGTLSVPAQEFRVLCSVANYRKFLMDFYAPGQHERITSIDFRNVRVSSAQFGVGNTFSETAGAGFDGYEYELLVDIERQKVPFVGF